MRTSVSARSANRERATTRLEPADLWRLGVLPVLAVGAVAGLFGVYWDIAWHIDKGRDSFFSPPHTFIYLAMLAALTMSVYGLARDRRGSRWHLSVGRLRLHPGLLIVAVAAGLELFFAPADELWHRVFGADATLWGPMHLIGLSALALLAFGGLVSAWVERALAASADRQAFFARLAVGFGAALLGLSVLFLAEYEYRVPAFPMFWQPLLITALPVFALVLLARLRPVPFAATWAALGFTALRLALAGFLMLTAGQDLAGLSRPALPLLLITGLAADLLAPRLPLWALGLALGLTGFLSNWALVLAFGGLPWHAGALALGLPLGLLLAVGAAYLGAVVAGALSGVRPAARAP
jgi:hypothetical protein